MTRLAAALAALLAASTAGAQVPWPDHRGDLMAVSMPTTGGTFTGQILIVDGTPGAATGRGIAFANDTDTGISRAGANNLVINSSQFNVYASDGSANLFQVASGSILLNGGALTFASASGWSCSTSSTACWLTQAQDTVQDARVIGSADAASEVATTLGTKYTDGQGGNTASIRLARFVTDADGTPSEKAWVGGDGAFNNTASAAGIEGNGASTGALCLNNGAGGPCLGPMGALTARRSSSTSSTSASLATTGLSITVTAGTTYALRFVALFNESTAADGYQFDFNGGTATITDFRADCEVRITGATAFDLLSETTTLAGTHAKAAAGSTNAAVMTCDGMVTIANAGTVIPRYAQNTHSTGTLTLQRGTYLRLEPLP